jgi:hypothetical protein
MTLNSEGRLNRVGIVQWEEQDGIATAIHDELLALGYDPMCFWCGVDIPDGVDVVFSFGPYGKFLPLARRVATVPAASRPLFVHWNTEGIPDLRYPWHVLKLTSDVRSWIGRLLDSDSENGRLLFDNPFLAWEQKRALRFRYVGDYYYAYKKGWLNVFADSSAIYAELHRRRGLPTVIAPWGGTPGWYRDLYLERDIDVLWMGGWGSKRRYTLLNRLRQELYQNGVRFHVADNVENPFIFGEERTYFLNRAKITLNLTRTWYDDNFSRFSLAAPNRSLVVSEPLLPHCPLYKVGIHYASAPIESLAETILYYLTHEEARLQIVENAYELVTTDLSLNKSIQAIMKAAEEVWQVDKRKS